MKKSFLLFPVLMIFMSSCSVQKPAVKTKRDTLSSVILKVLNSDDFKTAEFAFYAEDLNSGEVIAARNPYLALMPASTQKLLTTAAALEVLGPGYTFQTRLAYTGTMNTKHRFLDGDIILMGGGDPTLGSKYFNKPDKKGFLTEFLQAVARLGIDSVSGRVIGDAGYFGEDNIPPTRTWQNLGQYYGAPACGLSVYDNSFSVIFNTGAYGDTARIVGTVPHIPGLQIENQVTADTISFDNTYLFGAPYSNKRVARGTLPVHRNNFAVKAATPDPAYLAAWQLDSTLRANGISVAGKATTIRRIKDATGITPPKACHIFYTKSSPPLSQIIQKTNTYSVNLFAEHCLLAAGKALGAKNEVTACADSLVSFWKKRGMDTQGLSVNDGSGLSHYNAINMIQMVFLLDYMKHKSRYFDDFYYSLPVAGVSGTVQNMSTGSTAQGELRIKSGTVTRGKAYAGYVTTASGREVAFAMAVNNFSCTASEAAEHLWQVIKALQEFDR